MPRIGRPPQSEDALRARIDAYCARYGAPELNDEGFPVYPAGFRESPRHREWMALYKAFGRVRARIRSEKGLPTRECPICLRASSGEDRTHRRCAGVVKFLRELGPSGMDRIRAHAFPDSVGPVTEGRPNPKRKP